MARAATIRKRLVINEAFLATIGPRKIAQEYFAVVNSLSCKSTEDARKALDKFLSTLAQYEELARKQAIVQSRCDEELQHYEAIHADTTRQIAQAREDIEQLKQELVLAQLERANRAQYEEMSKSVNKHPTRDDLQAAIAAVQAEYEAAEAEEAAVNAKLEYRKSQFGLVFSAVSDVGLAIREEAEAEAAVQALKQAAKRKAAGGTGAADEMAEDDARAGREAGDDDDAAAAAQASSGDTGGGEVGSEGEGEGGEVEGQQGAEDVHMGAEDAQGDEPAGNSAATAEGEQGGDKQQEVEAGEL